MKPIKIRMPEGSRNFTLLLNIEIIPTEEVKPKRTVRRKVAKKATTKKVDKRTEMINAYKEAFDAKDIPTSVFKWRPRKGCACIAVDANYFAAHLAKHNLKGKDLAKHSRVQQSEISRLSNTTAPHRRDHSRYRRVSLRTFLQVYNHLPKADLDISKLLHPYNEPHNHCSPIYGGPRG